MKSLTRDNARFSRSADWSLNTTVPQTTAGNRYAILPNSGGNSESKAEKMGRVRTRTRAGPCERLFPAFQWRTLNSGAGDDAGGPIPPIRNRGE